MAWENLKAFENLKENKNASLNSQEKADLRNISLRDIQSQKEKIWNKTFLIGSESMKLKDIVNSLVFDEKWNRAQIKMRDNLLVTIGWGSELWAAIQVYAIANNKSIGDSWIDWMVWKNTVKWLQSTQNAVRAEGRKNPETLDDQDEVKEQSVARLVNAIYTEYVGKYSNESYNLLDTRSGVNQWTLKNKTVNGNKVTITYKSAIWKKENQKIVVDASTCKVWKQYSVDKFWKAIEETITKKESELKKKEDERKAKEKLAANQKIIVEGVEAYDVTNFSKKAQAYLKEKDYILNNHFNLKTGIGTWISFDGKGNLKFDDVFYVPKEYADTFCNNWKFDAVKFKAHIGPYLDKSADKYYQTQANETVAKIKDTQVTVGDYTEVKATVNNADNKIKRIKDLWVSIPAEAQKTLDKKKIDVKTVEDYNMVSKWVNAKIVEFDKKSNQSMSPAASKAFRNEVKNRYDNAKANTLIYSGKNVHNVYVKMKDGETKYQNSVVNKLKRVYDSVY